MIVIRSRTEGFRRCGLAHSIAPTQHPNDRFTADELERLLEEPMLMVEVLPNDTAKDDGKSADENGAGDGTDNTGDDADKADESAGSDASSQTDKPAGTKPANKKAGGE
jgi:hypothetical protein